MSIVVVTRDAARAAALATRLAAHGDRVVSLPCTQSAPVTGEAWQTLLAGVQAATDADGVAVASVNAAHALVRAAVGVRLPPVFAVGAATAEVVPGAILAGPDALALADALLARGVRRVLWPRAAEGRMDGIDRLRAAGVAVDAPIAYTTVSAPADDPAVIAGLAALAQADALCVYAPSQVEALAALGGFPTRARVVAIGETTAAALRARGVAIAAVADSPDVDAMASAVTRVLSTSS